ncbi:MAG: 30S ribosomal protein S9 [Alphaproteobacteria bacterium]
MGRAYGTGRRKESVGRVWIRPGSGRIEINGRTAEHYFPRAAQRIHALTPLRLTDHLRDMDVYATVSGGGTSGQAGALRHGLARALRSYNPELRRILRTNGLLTRDSRAVERKKYGRHKARRSTQFSKR